MLLRVFFFRHWLMFYLRHACKISSILDNVHGVKFVFWAKFGQLKIQKFQIGEKRSLPVLQGSKTTTQKMCLCSTNKLVLVPCLFGLPTKSMYWYFPYGALLRLFIHSLLEMARHTFNKISNKISPWLLFIMKFPLSKTTLRWLLAYAVSEP